MARACSAAEENDYENLEEGVADDAGVASGGVADDEAAICCGGPSSLEEEVARVTELRGAELNGGAAARSDSHGRRRYLSTARNQGAGRGGVAANAKIRLKRLASSAPRPSAAAVNCAGLSADNAGPALVAAMVLLQFVTLVMVAVLVGRHNGGAVNSAGAISLENAGANSSAASSDYDYDEDEAVVVVNPREGFQVPFPVLLLRQDFRDGFSAVFESEEEFLETNAGDPTSKKYSRMNQLDRFRRKRDGKFHFLLCYPSDLPVHSDSDCYYFLQKSDPTQVSSSAQPVEGLEVIKWLDGKPDGFAGLRADSRSQTFLDGSPGTTWYWAVGARQTYLSNGTIPGPSGRGAHGIVQAVELYALLELGDD